MFDRIGDIARQDHSSWADFGDTQQVFPAQHVGIEPIVKLHRWIAAASLHPLRVPEDLLQPVHVRQDFWVLSEDVSATALVQVQAMAKHIHEDHRHKLHIPHREATRKAPRGTIAFDSIHGRGTTCTLTFPLP